jgi:hypothetical protein
MSYAVAKERPENKGGVHSTSPLFEIDRKATFKTDDQLVEDQQRVLDGVGPLFERS